jgi:hypothetical protein
MRNCAIQLVCDTSSYSDLVEEKGGRLVPGGNVRFLFDVPRATDPQDAVIDDEAVFEGQLPATNES